MKQRFNSFISLQQTSKFNTMWLKLQYGFNFSKNSSKDFLFTVISTKLHIVIILNISKCIKNYKI